MLFSFASFERRLAGAFAAGAAAGCLRLGGYERRQDMYLRFDVP